MLRPLRTLLFVLLAARCSEAPSGSPPTVPVPRAPASADGGERGDAPAAIVVTARAPAATAREVERWVTVPLEIELAGIPGVGRMESASRDGEARITLGVQEAARVPAARAEVVERLSRYTPGAGERPVIEPDAELDERSLRYTLSGKGHTVIELRTLQDRVVRPYLLRVPGVADVVTCGGRREVVEVRLDPGRLAKSGTPIGLLFAALTPAKPAPPGPGSWSIGGLGGFASVRDIEDAVITPPPRSPLGPLRVRDVAAWSRGGEAPDCLALRDGAEVVEGIARVRRGEDVGEVARRLGEQVLEAARHHVLPPGVEIAGLDVDAQRGTLPSLVVRLWGATAEQAEVLASRLPGARSTLVERRIGPRGDAAEIALVVILDPGASPAAVTGALAASRSALSGVGLEASSRTMALRDRVVTLRVRGPDLAQLAKTAGEADQVMRGVRGLEVIGVLGAAMRPLQVLRFDPARLAQYGVPRDEALAWAEVVTTGHLTGSFAEGDGRTPIVVRVPPPPGGPSAIGAVSIPLPDGSTVPLSTLATITLEETPVAILREDLRRFVEVRAAVRGRDPGETLADARAALGARLELPHDVSVTLDGEALAKPSHP